MKGIALLGIVWILALGFNGIENAIDKNTAAIERQNEMLERRFDYRTHQKRGDQ